MNRLKINLNLLLSLQDQANDPKNVSSQSLKMNTLDNQDKSEPTKILYEIIKSKMKKKENEIRRNATLRIRMCQKYMRRAKTPAVRRQATARTR